MPTIGLIAAMPLESDALLGCIQEWKRVELGPLRGQSFELSGQGCLLVTSGMGVRRASEAARILVEMEKPGMLISFGIAGAVEADLQIGDVITAEAVCQLDRGVPGPLVPLSSWPETARAAAAQVLSSRGSRLLSGTAVTTEGTAVINTRLVQIVHPILEMETAGIARVAAERGIPLLSLRAISDGPCAPLPFNLGEMMDEDANLRGGRILKAIGRHPGIVFQFRRMIQNSRIAAGNAAVALAASLSHLTFG